MQRQAPVNMRCVKLHSCSVYSRYSKSRYSTTLAHCTAKPQPSAASTRTRLVPLLNPAADGWSQQDLPSSGSIHQACPTFMPSRESAGCLGASGQGDNPGRSQNTARALVERPATANATAAPELYDGPAQCTQIVKLIGAQIRSCARRFGDSS